MKKIPLTQGKFALVDDEDYDWLNALKWFAMKGTGKGAHWYACRWRWLGNGRQRMMRMHRFILGMKRSDVRQVDHINGDSLDNRRANLRLVSNSGNQQNRKGVKGYSHRVTRKRYQASIEYNGKTRYWGRYKTAAEARRAYLTAKEKYHTEVYKGGVYETAC